MQLKLNRLQMIRMPGKKRRVENQENPIVYAAEGRAICKLGAFFRPMLESHMHIVHFVHCLILTPTLMSV